MSEEYVNILGAIAVVSGFICGGIFRAKRRSFFGGFFLGFMLGVMGIFVALFWPAAENTKHKSHTERRGMGYAVLGCVVLVLASIAACVAVAYLDPLELFEQTGESPFLKPILLTDTPEPSATPPLKLASLPLITSFEDPSAIWPFISSPEFMANYAAKAEKYTSWETDSYARTGRFALNVIPNGNPDHGGAGRGAVSSAVLEPFDVSNYDTISLEFWMNSTSNPQLEATHNCGSSLNIYYKINSSGWIHKVSMCGSHKTEPFGWSPRSLDFDVREKSTIQFGFVYFVQNNFADPEVYFLIDDLEITAQ